jgi:hypothetical protein
MDRRHAAALVAALALVLSFGACEDDDTVAGPPTPCPNDVPSQGSPCPEPGLVCSYFTGCEQFYPATCQGNGTWDIADECVPFGGAAGQPNGGQGGTAGSAGQGTTAGTGGEGGSAGQGGIGGFGGETGFGGF